MEFLVIEHETDCHPGYLGQEWRAAGIGVTVCRPYAGDVVPEGAGGHDALVVLGGQMNCEQDDVAPWLPDTRSLIRTAVRAGVPTLGVCLGHQLMAVALGGAVVANPAGPTIGIRSLALTADADPLLAGLAGREVVHWNGDVVSRIPPGAQVLARGTDGAPQAIRFAPLAWGVQFHPEATPAIVESWATTPPISAATRRHGPTALAQVRAAADNLAAFAADFGAAFADQVSGRSRQTRR